MHPWIAEQANREHVSDLRSMGRPFGGWLAGLRLGRRPVGRGHRNPTWQGVTGGRRRVSIGF
jgi:hypothetical protein